MYPFQSGFRACHSTLTALLKVTDDLFKIIDNSEISLLILLDFSKAFDMVNHNLLLAKMKWLGVHESALEWFRSYLSGRYQKVVIKDDHSQWMQVCNGVPQGSILGPLLFTVLVCDLNKCISTGNIHMYADDTQLYYNTNVNNLNHTIVKANAELNNIAQYCKSNGLKLNAGKSICMFVGSRQNIYKVNRLPQPMLLINDVPIKRYAFARNLGVTFDEVLSWRRHINITVGKAYNTLRLLYKYKNFLSLKSKKILCDSLILSFFNYCDALLCNMNIQLQYKIQKVQNSCVRYIFGLRKRGHHRINNYLNCLGWLNMSNRRLLHIYVEVYKITNKLSANYLTFPTVSNVHDYSTRQTGHIYVAMRRTTSSSQSFMARAPLLFNDLPNDIKQCTSVAQFKKQCKNYLMTNQAAI